MTDNELNFTIPRGAVILSTSPLHWREGDGSIKTARMIPDKSHPSGWRAEYIEVEPPTPACGWTVEMAGAPAVSVFATNSDDAQRLAEELTGGVAGAVSLIKTPTHYSPDGGATWNLLW